MENTKTKVDLICGFLGAGKTTLLIKYCEYLNKNGISAAVVENEYGAAGIDCETLSACKITSFELSGGCICCSLKVGFHDLLAELSGRYGRIVVEPSGIYEISQFFDIINSLSDKCEAGAVITVVDPMDLDVSDEVEKKLLKGQLSVAGGVVLSKADVYGYEKSLSVMEDIRNFAKRPGLPLIYCGNIRDIPDSALKSLSEAKPLKRIIKKGDMSHSSVYNSTSLKLTRNYSEDEMKSILERIAAGVCGNVYRLKGFAEVEGRIRSLDIVHGKFFIGAAECGGETFVNAIGKSLKRKNLEAIFR